MTDQWVAAQHFVVTMAFFTANVLVWFRFRDAWQRERGWTPETTVLASWLCFTVAATLIWLYWFMRWLVKEKSPELSTWYVEQAWVTVPFGVAMSLAVASVGAAMLWDAYRWHGIGIAAGSVSGTWIAALLTVGLL